MKLKIRDVQCSLSSSQLSSILESTHTERQRQWQRCRLGMGGQQMIPKHCRKHQYKINRVLPGGNISVDADARCGYNFT